MKRAVAILPGFALCVGIAAAAAGLEHIEAHLFGRAWFEMLVLAILLGAAVRTARAPSASFEPGIKFCGKTLLEIAVAALGLTISTQAIAQAGWMLVGGIAVFVVLALGIGFGIGRMMGLSPRIAVLTACGNAICGNSAIAAVAPAIGATGAEIASSIAFTALLGVVAILLLPLALAAMTPVSYGVLAGLSVYAVPQVLVAAAPGGPIAVQMGTLVKLVRVLMLGPVVFGLALARGGHANMRLSAMVPWFIAAFMGLMAVRSLAPVPQIAVHIAQMSSLWLTVLAMAALGLGVDLRGVARAGPRVSAAVTLSLVAIAGMAWGLIRILGIS